MQKISFIKSCVDARRILVRGLEEHMQTGSPWWHFENESDATWESAWTFQNKRLPADGIEPFPWIYKIRVSWRMQSVTCSLYSVFSGLKLALSDCLAGGDLIQLYQTDLTCVLVTSRWRRLDSAAGNNHKDGDNTNKWKLENWNCRL